MYSQKNNPFIFNNIFIKSFLIFFSSRIFFSILIYLFLGNYDSRFFSFTDLEYYNNAELNIFSPNYFYAKLIQIIGYNSESMHSIFFLFLSSLISLIIVLPYIFISSNLLGKKQTYIFSLLLGTHPYIALYSLKFDSSLFPLLAISIFNLYFFYPSNKNYILLILSTSLCLLFRNSLLPFAILIYFYFFLKRHSFGKLQKLYIYLSILLVSFIAFSQYGYGIEFINQNFGCFSFGNISIFLNNYFNQSISNFLSYLFTPIIHLGLNLGAREAISIYCFTLPKEIASNNFINFSTTIIFFNYHLWIIIRLFNWIKSNLSLFNLSILIPFSILLPTLYGAAHLRYLLPVLPMLLLWQFMPKHLKVENS